MNKNFTLSALGCMLAICALPISMQGAVESPVNSVMSNESALNLPENFQKVLTSDNSIELSAEEAFEDVEFISMPEGVEITAYEFIRDASGYLVNIAIDGSYLYIEGLCPYFPEGVIRADYNSSTGVASIPQDQYVGIYMDTYLVMTKVILDDPELYLVLAPENMTYNLNVDLENKTISSAYYEGFATQPYLCFNASPDQLFYIYFMREFTMKEFPGYAGTPANPYNLDFDDYYFDDYGFYTFYFDLTTLSTEGNLLDSDCLYYRLFADGELLEFEYDPINDEYYGLEGIVSLIPYDFDNGNDIYSYGNTREFGIYSDSFEEIGVQMVYIYDDITTYSDTVILNIYTGEVTTGVDATSIGEIVKTEYYDIQGRKVLNPNNGIFIKRMIMADGQVITRKISLR